MTGEEGEEDEPVLEGVDRRRFLRAVAGAGAVSLLGISASETVGAQSSGGDELWSFETGDEVWSSPTVVDGTVFFGSLDNNVYALDAETGDEQWSFDTGGQVYSSPTVVDGTVFVGNRDGKVYALDAGVDGSSEDSRVLQGTLGHHNTFAEQETTTDGGDGSAMPGFGAGTAALSAVIYGGYRMLSSSADE